MCQRSRNMVCVCVCVSCRLETGLKHKSSLPRLWPLLLQIAVAVAAAPAAVAAAAASCRPRGAVLRLARGTQRSRPCLEELRGGPQRRRSSAHRRTEVQCTLSFLFNTPVLQQRAAAALSTTDPQVGYLCIVNRYGDDINNSNVQPHTAHTSTDTRRVQRGYHRQALVFSNHVFVSVAERCY
jgi:hypothetical protein